PGGSDPASAQPGRVRRRYVFGSFVAARDWWLVTLANEHRSAGMPYNAEIAQRVQKALEG
ncbi:MAG: hypothetical protein MK125_14390, partial [Dehalococcoidia bacterium]|nr:hypothetical protein [Dehalococcoidia bacterium]